MNMNSDTMLSPVLNGEDLKRAEASFLCCEISLREFQPETLFAVREIPRVGTGGPTHVDYELLRPTVRTRSIRCC